jgi:hypothetical protein
MMKHRLLIVVGLFSGLLAATGAIAADGDAIVSKDDHCLASTDPGFSGDIEAWVKERPASADPGFADALRAPDPADILQSRPADEGFAVGKPSCREIDLQDATNRVLDLDGLAPLRIDPSSSPEPSDS